MCREFARVDDRFIHGQVLLSWARELRLRRIVVGCDKLVKEKARKKLFELMSTSQLQINVFSVREAVDFIGKEGDGEGIMVIFGSLADALRYYRKGRRIKALNVGCLRFGVGKIPVTDSIFLSEEDREDLCQFISCKVKVEARGLPRDKSRDLRNFIE